MSVGALLVVALAYSLYNTAPVAARGRIAAQEPTDHNLKDQGLASHSGDPTTDGRDYWERLVGTPSRLARLTKKEGVLPAYKFTVENFDVLPFQEWLRNYSLLPDPQPQQSGSTLASIPQPPLSFICGVWINPTYKFIFIRNRKTASSTFLTAVKTFLAEHGLCEVPPGSEASHPSTCVTRLEPAELVQGGGDLAAIWREYTVITGTRNPWARGASGYQFTYDKWNRRGSAACAQPTFLQFCKDPFIMGKISNMFRCVDSQREGVGPLLESSWSFDFCHVEPAAPCMLDDQGKLVVDFVIRYERLEEDMQAALDLINERRPPNVPPIKIPRITNWNKKGSVVKASDINNTDAAAFVYAPWFRKCGAPCIDGLSDFYRADLELFGWDRPAPPPAPSTP